MEEHQSGLPKLKVAGMDHLKVQHMTANESRVRIVLERREFLIKEIRKLKNEVALRPSPSKVGDIT